MTEPTAHDLTGAAAINADVPLGEYIPGRQGIKFTLIPAVPAPAVDYQVSLHRDGSLHQADCDCDPRRLVPLGLPVNLTATVGDWTWFAWPVALWGVYRPLKH